MAILTPAEIAILAAWPAEGPAEFLDLVAATGRSISSVKSIVANLARKGLVEGDDEPRLTAEGERVRHSGDDADPVDPGEHSTEQPAADYAEPKAIMASAPAVMPAAYTAARMALELGIDARHVRRHLRAMHGALPAGVTGWNWPTDEAFKAEADAVRARVKVNA